MANWTGPGLLLTSRIVAKRTSRSVKPGDHLGEGLQTFCHAAGAERLRRRREGLPAICAGACGYLLKKTAPARLLESLKEAAGGGAPMSPEVASKVIGLFRKIRPSAGADYRLTPHEIRLLGLLVEGHNYKTAALESDVSVNTIRFHMRSIYEKLHVHSKSEAVAKALRERIGR